MLPQPVFQSCLEKRLFLYENLFLILITIYYFVDQTPAHRFYEDSNETMEE